jgi:C-methyltransferase
LEWRAFNRLAKFRFFNKDRKSSFEAIYNKPFFDFLNENPEKFYAYHKAMYQYAKDDYKTLPDVIDFSKHKSVMDVGGGYGAVLENIKIKIQS